MKTNRRSKLTQIFISHADEDKKDAECLKNWLSMAYTGIDVFLSSANGIHCGENPSKALEGAMGEADILIVLLSPIAVSKPWIVFEAGAVCGRHKTVLPLLCKGATNVAMVPAPIRAMFQVKLASRKNEFQDFLNGLTRVIGNPPANDSQSLRRRLSKKSADKKFLKSGQVISSFFCRATADAIEIKLFDGELTKSTTLRDVLPKEIRPLYDKYQGTNLTFQVALARCPTFCRENPKLFGKIRDANFWALNDHVVKGVKTPHLDPIFSRPLVEIYHEMNQREKSRRGRTGGTGPLEN